MCRAESIALWHKGVQRVLLCLLLGAVSACNRSSELAYRPDDRTEEHLSIAYLKSLCRAESHPIRSTCYVEGVITANDLYGEYTQALVIEDASGGIEIEVEGRELFRHFPIGRHLRIFCEGLVLADYGGKVILGAAPTGEYLTDRISERDRELHLHLLEREAQSPEPLRMEICEARLTDVGRYVALSDVAFSEEEKGLRWCESDPLTGETLATTRHLVDRAGDTLDLYLPATITYASEPLPVEELCCYGILDYFNRRFQLRITNRGVFPAKEPI